MPKKILRRDDFGGMTYGRTTLSSMARPNLCYIMLSLFRR